MGVEELLEVWDQPIEVGPKANDSPSTSDRTRTMGASTKGQSERGPTCDYGTSLIQWRRHRGMYGVQIERERPSYSYIINMLPPAARPTEPAVTIPAKHLHSSLNKIKHPIHVVCWTPTGRRLLTGSTSGEFTLWNGMSFNFETIMTAHSGPVRSVVWNPKDDFMLSADNEGIVKYWQENMNNVHYIEAHEDPIREIAFAPTGKKFISASDDSTVKVWDFGRAAEETKLTGHTWDVKTCDWHPSKGLVVSGSKDHLIKLWDPRAAGTCLTNIRSHKNTINKVMFEPSAGHYMASCARDDTARIFDIRMMREVALLKGHKSEITTLTIHPVHRSLVSTAGIDGSIHHYILEEPHPPPGMPMTIPPYDYADPQNAPSQSIYPAHKIPYAHEGPIWSLAWHPAVGHILASGSNDRVTRFWTRPRPGDTQWSKDRYHLGDTAAKAHGSWSSRAANTQNRDEEEQEQEDDAEALVDQSMPSKPTTLPGIPGLALPVQPGSDPKQNQPQLPGMGNAPPPLSFPPANPPFPNIPPSHTQGMVGTQYPLPMPLPPGQGNAPPPPPPVFYQNAPPPIGQKLPIAPGLITRVPAQPIDGPHNPFFGIPNLAYNNLDQADPNPESSGRRRAPLPSQEESLREEKKRQRTSR